MSCIKYDDPYTGEKKHLIFHGKYQTLYKKASVNSLWIGKFRSHHPVIMFSDGTVDDEDWFFRQLDQYNGTKVARYDGGYTGRLTLDPGAKVIVMSFDEWKKRTLRKEYIDLTFEEFVRKIKICYNSQITTVDAEISRIVRYGTKNSSAIMVSV